MIVITCGAIQLQSIKDVFIIIFQSKALGKILFEQVCKQLNLLEVDYFGLEYQDTQGITVSHINFYITYVYCLY